MTAAKKPYPDTAGGQVSLWINDACPSPAPEKAYFPSKVIFALTGMDLTNDS